MKTINILLILLLFRPFLFAQASIPKREFRGVWLTTVLNLDWPKSKDSNTQKQELVSTLDAVRQAGINVVIFQVRPECDAFYNSKYEPWSYYLTGMQGKSPSPYYDPLAFAITEAHKRGMELHAWFNPYRAVREIGAYPISSNHVSVQHPDWIITKGDFKSLDPGLPEVRDYVTRVIMDVVENYDVDGIHFDDYFYPEGMTAADDQATFDAYPNGFNDRGDWRRNNVNLLVAQVYNGIQERKPWIKFGISPAGIWKSGVPEGIVGRSAYSAIYCDALAWLKAKTVDYINPQCYWEFGGGQDYGKLINWWKSQANGRQVFSGNAAYRLNSSFSADELPRQLRFNRNEAQIDGCVLFRVQNGVLDNPQGFLDSLQKNLFRYPALLPPISWRDSTAPNPVQNLQYATVEAWGRAGLNWQRPTTAADGDSASRYVVYRFDHDAFGADELKNPKNILSVEGKRFTIPPEPQDQGPYYFVVTALDRNWNESAVSNILKVDAPQSPFLSAPLNGAPNQRDTVQIRWHTQEWVSSFRLQVAKDIMFTEPIFLDTPVLDTLYTLSGLNGQTTYYWRVSARNAGGTGLFASAFSFQTGFPSKPLLASPAHKATNISLNPVLSWHPQLSAQSYRVQLAVSNDFLPEKIVLDSSGVKDTLLTVGPLRGKKYHYWRVKAVNKYGRSPWSVSFRFKTLDPTAVASAGTMPLGYRLGQNYPNPFNPLTVIPFTLAEAGRVSVRIYDIRGRMVKRLLDEERNPGQYELRFNARDLSSGIYIYELRSKNFVSRKKMMLVR